MEVSEEQGYQRTSQGRDVTWLFCRCGHVAAVSRQEGMRADILLRARCGACGRLGADDLRHAYISD